MTEAHSRRSEPLPWAHPMGWWQALAFGIGFSAVLTSLAYCIWRGVTLSEPFHTRYWPFLVLFAIQAFGTPLMMEASERSRIKKGQARDIRAVLR